MLNKILEFIFFKLLAICIICFIFLVISIFAYCIYGFTCTFILGVVFTDFYNDAFLLSFIISFVFIVYLILYGFSNYIVKLEKDNLSFNKIESEDLK